MSTSIGSATLAPTTLAQAGKSHPAEPAPPAQDVASEGTATDSTVETQSELSSATARVGGQLRAQAAASRVGGAVAASATSAGYIAEADTNSDKKLSDQERVAYEKKLAQQAEAKAAATDQSRELRAAYGLSEEAAPGLAVTA